MGATVRNIEIRESGGECIRIHSKNVTIENVKCSGSFGMSFHFRELANHGSLTNSRSFNHNYGAYGNRNGNNIEAARYGGNIDKINKRHGLTGNSRRKKMQCYAGFGHGNDETKACNGEGWGAGIFSRAIGTQFIKNVVHAGYGENIIVGCGAREALIDGNTSVGGKVGIYLDGGSGSIIKNNMVMGTKHREFQRGDTAGQGIALNREPYCTQAAQKMGRGSSNKPVEIYNNIVSGRSSGLVFWAEVSTKYESIKIYNNAFINNKYAIQILNSSFSNSFIANNFFIKTGNDSSAIGLIGGISGDTSKGLKFFNNYWSHNPEKKSTLFLGKGSYVGNKLQFGKDSGYFSIDGTAYMHPSWVDPNWMPVIDQFVRSAGADLRPYGINYKSDFLNRTAVGSEHHIGPLIENGTYQSPPKAPMEFKIL